MFSLTASNYLEFQKHNENQLYCPYSDYSKTGYDQGINSSDQCNLLHLSFKTTIQHSKLRIAHRNAHVQLFMHKTNVRQ